MTISNIEDPVDGPYPGNDSQTEFPFNFKTVVKTDVQCVLADPDGVETILVLDSDFSIALNADQNNNPGGTMTYPLDGGLDPLPTDWSVTIESNVQFTQPADIVNAGNFHAQVHEDTFDRIVMLVKQVNATVRRALRLSVSTPDGVDATLPVPLAGAVIGWDADGASLANYSPDTSISTAQLEARLADDVVATNGDAMIGVNSGETGEVGRTLDIHIKASRRSLFRFLTTTEIDDGLSGVGSIDISAKFQSFINACGGKFGEIPEGRWRAESLTLTAANTVLCGLGPATTILLPSAGNPGLTVSGEFTEIRHINMAAAVARSGAGWYVDFAAGANRSSLKDFNFDGWRNCIRTAAAATLSIERGTLLNGVAASGVGIRVNAGFDVSIRDIIIDQALQIFAGILVTQTGDTTIEDCNIVHGGQALFINPAAGQVVASVWANNSYFDTSTRGLYAFAQGAGANIVRCKFDECWFSGNTSEGIRLETSGGGAINGMTFVQPDIMLNGANGLSVIDTGSSNVRVRDATVAGNTGAGLFFEANVTRFSVLGSRIGDADGLAGNANGIVIGAGTGANFTIADNDLSGNVGVALSDGSTGTGRLIRGNLGDPTTGFASAITVGASPYTHTAGARAEFISVRGGTVSAIAVGGTGIATATDREVLIPAGGTVTVTYTVLPTMTRVFQ